MKKGRQATANKVIDSELEEEAGLDPLEEDEFIEEDLFDDVE